MSVKEKLVELLKKTEINKIKGHTVLAETCFTPNVFANMATNLIAHGVTVQEWISIEAGELQNYIGVPVCIKRKTDGECWWAIIRGIKGDKVSTDYGGYFKLSEYGETWMVKYLPLPQPPKGE